MMRSVPRAHKSIAISDIRVDEEFSYFSHHGGRTHYQLIGREGGDLIAMVPGSTLPLAVWTPLVDPLVEAGYRVLRFDLAGRGRSSPLKLPVGLASDAGQLADLLKRFQSHSRIFLVGLASGAFSAVAFANQNPGLISGIGLIAPDGVSTRFNPVERLSLAPVLGEILSAIVGKRVLLSRANRYSSWAEVRDFVRRLLLFSLEQPNYRKALLKYVRALPFERGEALYAECARTGLPARIVWGSDDKITPISAAGYLQQIFGNHAVQILDEAGHLPFVEEPDVVAAALCHHFGNI